MPYARLLHPIYLAFVKPLSLSVCLSVLVAVHVFKHRIQRLFLFVIEHLRAQRLCHQRESFFLYHQRSKHCLFYLRYLKFVVSTLFCFFMFFPCYLIFHPLCFVFPLAFVSTRLPRPKNICQPDSLSPVCNSVYWPALRSRYLLYRHVAFFGGEAQPFSAGAPYAPLGQEGEVVICLPEAVELFVPAVACGRPLRQKIHYMDVGKAMVYAVLYQLQFLRIQEESANAGFAPAEKACPGVELLMESPHGQVIVRP